MRHRQSELRLCFSLALSLFFISGCSTAEDNARFQIHNLTDIEIPAEASLVYNFNSEVFVGRATRYSVFGFEEKPVYFLHEHGFTDTKSGNFQKEFAQDVESFLYFVSKHVSGGIPEQYLVNWDEDYSWLYHREDVYFVYSDTSQYLIIYIVGH